MQHLETPGASAAGFPRKKYDRKAAARYITEQRGIAVAEQTLANQAAAGKGPRYSLMLGRAIYDEADLDAWVDAQFAAGVVTRPAA